MNIRDAFCYIDAHVSPPSPLSMAEGVYCGLGLGTRT